MCLYNGLLRKKGVRRTYQILLFIIFFVFSNSHYGKDILQEQSYKQNSSREKQTSPKKSPEPPKLGNFALGTSQQPGPLMSFGQTNIDKNQSQFYLLPNYLSGQQQHYTTLTANYEHGITDSLDILFNVPVAVSYRDHEFHSSGLSDIYAQIEYAYYNKSTAQFADQATLVAGMSIPTGSAYTIPATGFGAPSFFIGGTLNRMYVDWYLFTSEGALLMAGNDDITFGNQYYYQFGLGRAIASTKNWILACLVELDGTYFEHRTIEGELDPDSGGNVITLTPSIWFSTKKLIFQFGMGFFPVENLFGEQFKLDYLLAGSFGYTFD